jgi:hypothetical protein
VDGLDGASTWQTASAPGLRTGKHAGSAGKGAYATESVNKKIRIA